MPHASAAWVNAGDRGLMSEPAIANSSPRSASTGPDPGDPDPDSGSGKPGTPLRRMHCANLSAARCWLAVMWSGAPCLGPYLAHAFWADWNAGDCAEPIGMLTMPRCPGSGKVGTPWERMHWANFSAGSLPPGPEPVVPASDEPPPHAAS